METFGVCSGPHREESLFVRISADEFVAISRCYLYTCFFWLRLLEVSGVKKHLSGEDRGKLEGY